jgi:cellulase/cellobiase CelA1
MVGTAASVTVHATDSASGQTLTYTATGLPTGLSISSSGVISGTPTAAGTFGVTVTATDGTGATGTATFTWTITGSGGGGGSGTCHVTDTINAWNTGLTSSITITNTGSSAISGWSLVFTLPSGQTITSGWNATYSPSSGQVTATNASYDGAIAPNASVNIGFQANQSGNAGAPSSFALNGASCAVG